MGTSGEEVEVRQTPNLDALRTDLQVNRVLLQGFVCYVCMCEWCGTAIALLLAALRSAGQRAC